MNQDLWVECDICKNWTYTECQEKNTDYSIAHIVVQMLPLFFKSNDFSSAGDIELNWKCREKMSAF